MPPRTKQPTLDAIRARREEILRIAAAHGASNLRVFGSVARGEDDEKSDLDLLVDFDDTARGFAYFGRIEDLRLALAESLGHQVDIMDSAGLKETNITTPRLRKVKNRVLDEVVPL